MILSFIEPYFIRKAVEYIETLLCTNSGLCMNAYSPFSIVFYICIFARLDVNMLDLMYYFNIEKYCGLILFFYAFLFQILIKMIVNPANYNKNCP